MHYRRTLILRWRLHDTDNQLCYDVYPYTALLTKNTFQYSFKSIKKNSQIRKTGMSSGVLSRLSNLPLMKFEVYASEITLPKKQKIDHSFCHGKISIMFFQIQNIIIFLKTKDPFGKTLSKLIQVQRYLKNGEFLARQCRNEMDNSDMVNVKVVYIKTSNKSLREETNISSQKSSFRLGHGLFPKHKV